MPQKKTSWAIIYLFGVLLAIGFLIGVLKGKVKVHGWRKFPHRKGRVLVAANHPSLLDPFLMVALFFPSYLLRPKKWGPRSVGDEKNYSQHWLWSRFNEFIIPVARPEPDADEAEKERAGIVNSQSKEKSVRILNDDGNILIFPEGTRTKSDKPLRKPRLEDGLGHEMRRFIPGVSVMARETGALVVPVWTEITWEDKKRKFRDHEFWWPESIRVSIGDPIRFKGDDHVNTITRTIEQAVLAEARNC